MTFGIYQVSKQARVQAGDVQRDSDGRHLLEPEAPHKLTSVGGRGGQANQEGWDATWG